MKVLGAAEPRLEFAMLLSTLQIAEPEADLLHLARECRYVLRDRCKFRRIRGCHHAVRTRVGSGRHKQSRRRS
jgi:hypothetical protein